MYKRNLYIFLVLLGQVFYKEVKSANHLLTCRTYGTPDGTQLQLNDIHFSLDGNIIEYNGCTSSPAIIIAVMDSGCTFWNNCGRYFGHFNVYNAASGSCTIGTAGSGNCRNRRESYFIFRLSDSIQVNNISYMFSQIPDGHFILAYTWFNYEYSAIPAFKQAFQNLGAVSINNLQDYRPYIFLMQKGNPSSLIEINGVDSTDMLTLTENINCGVNGMNDPEVENGEIYPNPVADKIILKKLMNDNVDWKVYSISGQIISTGYIKSKLEAIDVSMLASGIYYLRVTSDSERRIYYFMKE